MSRIRVPLALAFASALFVFAPTVVGAAGPDTGDAKNEVSIDLAMPIALNLAASEGVHAYPLYLCYERVLSEHWVLSIAPSLFYVDRVSDWSFIATLWLELDWHPFRNGLRGFFLGPAVAMSYGTDVLYTKTLEGIGATVGYQFLLPWNLDIDVAVGLVYGPLQSNDPYSPGMQGIFRAALAVGYRF